LVGSPIFFAAATARGFRCGTFLPGADFVRRLRFDDAAADFSRPLREVVGSGADSGSGVTDDAAVDSASAAAGARRMATGISSPSSCLDSVAGGGDDAAVSAATSGFACRIVQSCSARALARSRHKRALFPPQCHTLHARRVARTCSRRWLPRWRLPWRWASCRMEPPGVRLPRLGPSGLWCYYHPRRCR
jgi:hypothetical protein